MIRTALAVIPFMNDLKEDLRGTLQKIKDMGYEGVEFAYGLNYNPLELKNILEDIGLELVGWHIDRTYIYEELYEVMVHYMESAGNHRLVIPWLPDSYTESEEAWKKTAEEFNQLAEKLEKRGISLGYHNHQKEFQRTGADYLFDSFCQNIDSRVRLQLDVGNMLSAGAAPEKFLEKYIGKFETVHIKPYSLETGFHTMIGQDSIDYEGIVGICQKSGTQWFIIEYECKELLDKYTSAEKCLEQFKKYNR